MALSHSHCPSILEHQIALIVCVCYCYQTNMVTNKHCNNVMNKVTNTGDQRQYLIGCRRGVLQFLATCNIDKCCLLQLCAIIIIIILLEIRLQG